MRAPATRPALTLALALLASPAAHAACKLADIVPGGTYTYRMTGPGSGTFTTTNAVKGNSVRATTTIDGRTSTMTWTCTGKGLSGTLIRIPSVSLTDRNSTDLPTPRPETASLLLASARVERFLQTIQPESVSAARPVQA